MAIDIEEFADIIGVKIIIRQRSESIGDNSRYYANFDNSGTGIKHGESLIGTSGNGSTPNDALRDFAREISGQILMIDAFGKKRREFSVPELSYQR